MDHIVLHSPGGISNNVHLTDILIVIAGLVLIGILYALLTVYVYERL